MFSKISNMLGKAYDFGSNLIKPFKNTVSNGWEMLKNGASKVGQFVSDNHETIGTVLSGVGNIIGNLPNSPLKQKLENFGNSASNAGNMFSNGFNYMSRPQNTPRQQFSNNINNRYNPQPMRQQPQITRQQPLAIPRHNTAQIVPRAAPTRPQALTKRII